MTADRYITLRDSRPVSLTNPDEPPETIYAHTVLTQTDYPYRDSLWLHFRTSAGTIALPPHFVALDTDAGYMITTQDATAAHPDSGTPITTIPAGTTLALADLNEQVQCPPWDIAVLYAGSTFRVASHLLEYTNPPGL